MRVIALILILLALPTDSSAIIQKDNLDYLIDALLFCTVITHFHKHLNLGLAEIFRERFKILEVVNIATTRRMKESLGFEEYHLIAAIVGRATFEKFSSRDEHVSILVKFPIGSDHMNFRWIL